MLRLFLAWVYIDIPNIAVGLLPANGYPDGFSLRLPLIHCRDIGPD